MFLGKTLKRPKLNNFITALEINSKNEIKFPTEREHLTGKPIKLPTKREHPI